MIPDGKSYLGICYADNHLFYAVHKPGQENDIQRIGSIDFNFDIYTTLCSGSVSEIDVLKKSIQDLKTEFKAGSIHMLYPADRECWTVVPRAVYEDSSERESHIEILMNGSERSEIEISWHQLANTDNKLLLLRDNTATPGLTALNEEFGSMQFSSDFEIAQDWQIHSENHSAFMMVHCHNHMIVATSFILGNMRGCTYFEYEDPEDLPYLWSLYASHTPWMNGIHDKIFAYGLYAKKTAEQLASYWSHHGELIFPDSLTASNVQAEEKTYGFPLESAYPAIILSLQSEKS